MDATQTTGLILVAAGTLAILFRRPVGTAWCRLGQFTWNRAKLPWWSPFSRKEMLKLYDDKEAPRIGLFIGLLLLVDGVVFLLLPLLVRYP